MRKWGLVLVALLLFVACSDDDTKSGGVADLVLLQGGNPVSACDFGSTRIGQSAAQTLVISNGGSAILQISSLPTITGSGSTVFAVDSLSSSNIIPGATAQLQLTFVPATNQLYQASLTIQNNDPDNTSLIVPLSGTGTIGYEPEISLQIGLSNVASGGSVSFGQADLNVAGSAVSLRIENKGSTNLTLSGNPGIAIAGPQAGMFVIAEQPAGTLEDGTNFTTTITFSPTAAGAATATLYITNDDADEGVYSVQLTGSCSAPEIGISQSGSGIASGGSFSFPTTQVNTFSSNLIFTISNTGAGNLHLTNGSRVEIIGADAAMFSVIAQPAALISGNTESSFTIRFSPTASGTRTATVRIYNNDADEGSHQFTIQGFASDPEIKVQYGTLNQADGSARYMGKHTVSSNYQITMTITNIGVGDLQLTGSPVVQISGTDASYFSVVSQPTNVIAAGEAVQFSLVFSPTQGGPRAAQVTIPNNDADESSFTINLSGDGQGWGPVGSMGFAASTSSAISVSYSVPEGVPYVSYLDPDAAGSTFSVRKFDGSSWNLVGAAGDAGSGLKSQLHVTNGTPYVMTYHASTGTQVRKYSGTWTTVGGGYVYSGSGNFPEMGVNDASNTVYVAAARSTVSDRVLVYASDNNGAWQTVSTNTDGVSPGAVGSLDAAFHMAAEPRIYLAYSDITLSGKATALSCNWGTDFWYGWDSQGFTSGSAGGIRLGVDYVAQPYIAFTESSGRVSVMGYGSGSFSYVGSAGFSATTATQLQFQMAFISGTGRKMYVAYRDTSDKPVVMTYNTSTTQWDVLGRAGISDSTADYLSLTAVGNTVFIAYQDAARGDRITVMKYYH